MGVGCQGPEAAFSSILRIGEPSRGCRALGLAPVYSDKYGSLKGLRDMLINGLRDMAIKGLLSGGAFLFFPVLVFTFAFVFGGRDEPLVGGQGVAAERFRGNRYPLWGLVL